MLSCSIVTLVITEKLSAALPQLKRNNTMFNDNPETTIRAWKDKSFRAGLHAADLANLPAHPAGSTELTETELDSVAGGLIDHTDTNMCLTFLNYCNLY